MRTILKTIVVGLMVTAMSLSPAMMSLSTAGGINFEGFGAANSYETKGLMLNFSFGGPDDYNKTSAFEEVYKNNLNETDWAIIGAGALGLLVLWWIAENDEDCVPRPNGNDVNTLAFEPIYVNQINYCTPERKFVIELPTSPVFN
jgi:hypothetical protein